jgi:hypothetical protein
MSFQSMVHWNSVPKRVRAPHKGDIPLFNDCFGLFKEQQRNFADKGKYLQQKLHIMDKDSLPEDEGTCRNISVSDEGEESEVKDKVYVYDNCEGSNVSVPDESDGKGVSVLQGVDLGFVSPVENRVCWVKLPRGDKVESIEWWPGLLYETFGELIQDVRESSM